MVSNNTLRMWQSLKKQKVNNQTTADAAGHEPFKLQPNSTSVNNR